LDVRYPMETEERIAATYQALGEFVIIFQWVEHLYRQIGWLILDPRRESWPPKALRKESNFELIEKVSEMFDELIKSNDLPGGNEKAQLMASLKPHFHNLRKYRNALLHSTFIELKAGREVVGYLRTDPVVDSDTGELIFNHEDFSAAVVHEKIREYGEHMFQLNLIHTQVIHWSAQFKPLPVRCPTLVFAWSGFASTNGYSRPRH
jgi:hypothetical protein